MCFVLSNFVAKNHPNYKDFNINCFLNVNNNMIHVFIHSKLFLPYITYNDNSAFKCYNKGNCCLGFICKVTITYLLSSRDDIMKSDRFIKILSHQSIRLYTRADYYIIVSYQPLTLTARGSTLVVRI